MAPLIAWLNALMPALAVGVGYGIALWQREAVACLPFIEGCTSVSRAMRHGDALFWFRGLMMPLSMLMVFYWVLQRRWLNQTTSRLVRHDALLWLGLISALALVLYANYLGSDGDFYRFMRRFGVTFYFAFAMLAQLISVYSLQQYQGQLSQRTRTLVRWQFGLVTLQWCLGLVSLGFTITQPDFKHQADNILEWNFGLAMIAFYAVSGLIWQKEPPKPAY